MSRTKIKNTLVGDHKSFEALPTLDNKNIHAEAKSDGPQIESFQTKTFQLFLLS